MLDWTNRHSRFLMRLLTKHTLLYTEMVTTGAIIHGNLARHLDFSNEEHPIALQFGGSDPKDLAHCAKIAEQYAYDEINLNVGCPSGRVQSGAFGACLMAKPELVAECVSSMRAVVDIPVTVKTRIGIDDLDSYEHLHHFVSTVKVAGCKTFIIHARKAWLSGLSPKENREVPPLQYGTVNRLKQDFPELEIILNVGVKTLESMQEHLGCLDGVMIGREAYQHPYFLADFDRMFFGGGESVVSREAIVMQYMDYAEMQLGLGVPLHILTKPLLGLFHAQPGGKQWRRYLSENAHKQGADISVVRNALETCRAASFGKQKISA